MKRNKQEPEFLDIHDLCEIYDMTEGAARKHIERGTGALPVPIRQGGRRLRWLRVMVDEHIAKQRRNAA